MEIDKIIKKDVLEFMETIPDNKIDLIVTDPPYLINYKTNWRKEKHKFSNVIKNDNNPELIKEYIKECYRILKDDTAIYIFCSFDKVDFFKKEIEKYFSVKNIIIWRKNNHTAGDLEAQFGKQYEMIILANKGRKKFSGTTALAALETDRHFIGTEIDEYYFGIAEERIKNHNAQLSLFDEV
ncbi:TPA: site-specific DNA-methyltransferase [Streptococcus pneumoniae]|uniref:DNA-methyltransferase n=1 Tax=Streptococcus pneumoniae TaxID=1313 RepID=UPI0005E3160A|nr:site-specific DNA-methyltransferase [Streptococcus pneumoniae]CAG6060770.1 adenine-specific methyltransferase [Streptococcus pneumoniae]CTF95319.1 putative prophage protein [Streptococcus pneumoniae]HET0758779.1 site-specific DNA-methyltransferase [Streptococcus pneumoniae]HET0776879.1 site-specific DNA-methyltransferase [Streptococcus pneumoniae]HET1302874.1 site-specific DNA-methyltransferase [Streptococcus pneumoniae]